MAGERAQSDNPLCTARRTEFETGPPESSIASCTVVKLKYGSQSQVAQRSEGPQFFSNVFALFCPMQSFGALLLWRIG